MGAPDDEYDALTDGVLSALVNGPASDAVGQAVASGLGDMAAKGWSAAAAERHTQGDRLDPFVQRVHEWWKTVPPQA
jgi:hypothetical protein